MEDDRIDMEDDHKMAVGDYSIDMGYLVTFKVTALPTGS
jgi:hypothetical protein